MSGPAPSHNAPVNGRCPLHDLPVEPDAVCEGCRAGLSRVSGLTLAPDDVIVVECDELVPQDRLDRIRGLLEGVFPGHTVVVLDRSIRLTVVHAAEAD